MLWAMCHGGDMPEDGAMDEEPQGMDEFDWVMKVSSSIPVQSYFTVAF